MQWSVLLLAALCVVKGAEYEFGTYYKLWNAQSLWNCRPVNPVFAPNVTVPESDYYPSISSGAYSTGVFQALPTDPPATIYPRKSEGINNVDNLSRIPNITIPHWPSDALPATGSDGHCDIVDEELGVVHSFWQLSKNNVTKQWIAELYAWTPLKGTGWGDPSHYYQGARAAAVPTSAGVIRSHEVKDGSPYYKHALAMSMTYNGLSKDPNYVYPATSSDWDYNRNYGKIPEGALMMLPPDYNTSRIASTDLRKVAETLKVYGAYVVDRNDGTPYAIYVENGAPFKMSNLTTWDTTIANELQRIRAALRMVTSADYYVDGNGDRLLPAKNVNLLSMRGSTDAWQRVSGDSSALYDTQTQSLAFSGNHNKTTTYQNWSGLGINQVKWAKLQAGTNYTYFVEATANVTLKLEIRVDTSVNKSYTLGDGRNASFVWPAGGYVVLYAYKPAGPLAGSVRGFILETESITGPTPIPSQRPTGQSTTGSAPVGTTGSAPVGTTGVDGDNAGAINYPSLFLLVVLLAYMF